MIDLLISPEKRETEEKHEKTNKLRVEADALRRQIRNQIAMATRIPSDSPHLSPRVRDPMDCLDYLTLLADGGVGGWCCVDGVWMACGWRVDGMWMACVWRVHGVCMVCAWCLGGV